MTSSEFEDDGPSICDVGLGLPGPAEPLPDDDATQVVEENVNDDAD